VRIHIFNNDISFDFYCMLSFVTLGANYIGFNYIIIIRQGWTNIYVGHIRDYSIHNKYRKETLLHI
jgi:hypothetical protein